MHNLICGICYNYGHLYHNIGMPLSEANREQRVNDIVTRKELVETIKNQDKQMSVLRSELERLRMRAFPALVQID